MTDATRASPDTPAAAATTPTTVASPPPPPAPRDVTPAAARRAWHEPRVHFWWIVALGLVGAAIWIAILQGITWNREARLLRIGTRVDAMAWPSGARIKARPISEEDQITLEFAWNGQPTVLGNQRLVGRGRPTLTGETFPIYVDPEDPRRWTARTEPASPVNLMMAPIALLAMASGLTLVSVVKRRGVVKIWRNGEARQAAVVETMQTALAPRSRLVRCALTDGTDRRLINVYVPRRVAEPQRGDRLWLIMPPGRPERAVAASAFGA